MAKPNKASIKFKLDTEDADFIEIRFHSVVFEDHDVTNEITKFPVQSGFNISNHSIRKNRKIGLKAIITNTQMISSEEFKEYSANSNSRAVYAMLKTLVRDAISCTVTTNLDEYTPVIFTGFKTKQEAGMTDAMNFILTGEEIQLGTAINSTTPTKLVFTPVPDAEREALLSELRAAGFNPSDDVQMSQTNVDLNDSFSVGTLSVAGKEQTVTYDHKSYDSTSSEHSYECSISDDGTVTDEETGAVTPGSVNSRLANGANVFGACLTEQLVDLATSETEKFIDTAVGELKKNIYGGLYEILGVNGDRSMGQRLLALGLDCFIVGAVSTTKTTEDGAFAITADQFDTTFPTADDALEGAAKTGDSVVTDTLGQSSPTTITKLSGSSVGTTSFFGDLL